jgi:hypothetical protein
MVAGTDVDDAGHPRPRARSLAGTGSAWMATRRTELGRIGREVGIGRTDSAPGQTGKES